MAKGRRKTPSAGSAGPPAGAAGAAPAREGSPPGPWALRLSRPAALVCALLLLAWGTLCLRAAQHYGAGRAAEGRGELPEAAREYESAVGCCAPLNPYCGAAARALGALAGRTAAADPRFSEEARDRLLRALRGSRSLVQPHRDLLEVVQSSGPALPPREPNSALFLLAFLTLGAGLGAWWLPRPLGLRASLALGGMALGAGLLYLC